MTERLYYGDSFLYRFDAKVTEVRELGGRRAVVLDRTAFYPTSGGQTFDTGTLQGSGGSEVRVEEVVETEDGTILHYVSAPFEAGAAVTGSVDAIRRRDHIQQHSGSGTHDVYRRYVSRFRRAAQSASLVRTRRTPARVRSPA